MRPSEALRRHRAEIRRIVESGNATNPRVFGSVLHGRDTEASDLDILVDPTQATTMFDIGAIRYRLRDLLGVPVDVLTPKAFHEKMRDAVLSEAQPIRQKGRSLLGSEAIWAISWRRLPVSRHIQKRLVTRIFSPIRAVRTPW